MATWEDLDNESESDKEDAEDEAKIAMALVATDEDKDESSDAESCADSQTETQVYSKLTRPELVESIKELLNLYENQSSELKKYKCHTPIFDLRCHRHVSLDPTFVRSLI